MVYKVSSLAPGARKYVDVGKFSNNLVVDVDKLREAGIFHFSIWVNINFKKFQDCTFCFDFLLIFDLRRSRCYCFGSHRSLGSTSHHPKNS